MKNLISLFILAVLVGCAGCSKDDEGITIEPELTPLEMLEGQWRIIEAYDCRWENPRWCDAVVEFPWHSVIFKEGVNEHDTIVMTNYVKLIQFTHTYTYQSDDKLLVTVPNSGIISGEYDWRIVDGKLIMNGGHYHGFRQEFVLERLYQ